MTLRRDAVDRYLESVNGVDVWYESVRGAEARVMFDARHLRAVLRERTRVGLKNDPHETRHLKPKQPEPLKVLKADRGTRSA
jgi:hypothetical protein